MVVNRFRFLVVYVTEYRDIGNIEISSKRSMLSWEDIKEVESKLRLSKEMDVRVVNVIELRCDD